MLLGALLVRRFEHGEVAVRLTEVEAYEGESDPASHAFRGRTARNGVMFGEAGHLYCYFVYGMHWCANLVCGVDGSAAAVLLRAAEIVEGADLVRSVSRSNPRLPDTALASGPARLARVLALDGSHTGLDVLDPGSSLQLRELPAAQGKVGNPANGIAELAGRTRTGPRVGVASAADLPLRFWLDGERSVSAYRRGGRRSPTGRGAAESKRQT